MFTGQNEHDVEPTVCAYIPALQSMHLTLSVVLLYFPRSHATQRPLPVTFLNVPGKHCVSGAGVVVTDTLVLVVDVGAGVVVSSSGQTRLQEEIKPPFIEASLVSLICRYPVFEGYVYSPIFGKEPLKVPILP